MSQIIRYVGFDTSKETIAVAIADQDGSVVDHGAIHNDPGAIRKLIERLATEVNSGWPMRRAQPATRSTAS